MPMIEGVRLDAAMKYEDLDLIAVTVGPGSFTGIRVGVAAARGIAVATGNRAVGVTTLAAIAQRAVTHEGVVGPLVSIIDARRDEAYIQMFNVEDGVIVPSWQSPTLDSIAHIADRLHSERGAVVGSGAAKLIDALVYPARWRRFDITVPDGASIAHLAAVQARGPDRAAAGPTPLYIRKPDTNRRPKTR